MTTEMATIFDRYSCDIHENYSGRAMYGKTTAAVAFSDLNALLEIIGTLIETKDVSYLEPLAEFLKSGVETDNLGRDILIY